MSGKVIDADYVRKVVQGSANIDRMRKEIHQVITLLVSLIPTDIPRNEWHHRSILCPMEHVPVQYHHFIFMRWVLGQEPIPKGGTYNFCRQKSASQAKISLFVETRASDVWDDRYARPLYTSGGEVSLEYVLLVHSQLPILIAGLIEGFGARSELADRLNLLANAA
ncbi:MAG: hypothetical protein KBD16_04295 [Candidatus Pacebacteria bacterium]|nr:hypothetical protein [Candidatus Paceibacterota bacterium]